jgi:LVIVD repeat-containing protein
MNMRRTFQMCVLVACIGALLAIPAAASAADPPWSTFTYTNNMHPLGFSARENTNSPFTANSDLAFWGKTAYQGNYDGFRIVDVTEPDNPVELNDYRDCAGNQGDVIIWQNILVRSWNSPAPAGATCDGEPVPQGWEGVHVFDVSNPADPDLVASVETECGSHTATGVPDMANGRLLVYNNASSGACPGLDIIGVPLANPAGASLLHDYTEVAAGRACHDTGVILGDALKAACAGGNGFSVFSMDPADGGSLELPKFLYSVAVPGVTVGHSAAFSWDGEVLIFGHEPGGGSQARCQATSSTVDKTVFFFDADTGAKVGEFVNPRPQTATENCTWHNYNVVPTSRGHILVAAQYQAGISVVDFSNPSSAKEIAYADPAPLSATQLILGGDWSDYWYNGRIYESDITRGLLIWRLSDRAVASAMKLGHLNPQTQEFTIG